MAGQLTIGQALQRLGGEAFLQRLIGQVEAVAQATDETGQPGKVTLTVKTVKPKEASIRDQYVAFETSVAPTYPKPKPHKTGLYVNGDGLHTAPPDQIEMDLKVVSQGQPETRTVTVGQPEARQA